MMWLEYVKYAIRWRMWPSRLQRLHMQGDPTGEVAAVAARIRAELGVEDGE